jgi:hypothetical protein
MRAKERKAVGTLSESTRTEGGEQLEVVMHFGPLEKG